MINKNTTIEVTIEVPIANIKIIDLRVDHQKETRHCPEDTDVTYNGITIDGLNEDFEIIDYEDNLIDQLGELRWNAGETE